MAKIIVQNTEITVLSHDDKDYISLTDMANGKQSESRAADVIKNWIRTRYTIEFLGTWEMIHNPNFKVVEFDHFRMQAGLPSFVMSVSEWIEKTNAIGIIVKKGRYGGTYAFKDIMPLASLLRKDDMVAHMPSRILPSSLVLLSVYPSSSISLKSSSVLKLMNRSNLHGRQNENSRKSITAYILMPSRATLSLQKSPANKLR